LPHVEHSPCCGSSRNFDYERPLLLHVPEAEGVKRRDIRRKHPGFVLQVLIEDDITILRTKGFQMREMKGVEADGRQCPNERLSRTGKVDLVVKFTCGIFGREAILKPEPPNASLDILSLRYRGFLFFLRHHNFLSCSGVSLVLCSYYSIAVAVPL